VPAGRALLRLTQVHGPVVVFVGRGPVPPGAEAWAPGPAGRPPEGDALVGVGDDHCLAVLVADCAPVALASPDGVHGAVHVGWRGLAAGILERAVPVMRALGAGEVVAELGPCIGPCCYEFSPADMAPMVDRYGPSARGRTTSGAPALNMVAAITSALGSMGVVLGIERWHCTACSPDDYSHRRDGDEERQALLVWQR